MSLKPKSQKPVRKTTEEINSEIAKLKSLQLPRLDAYGGNNFSLLKAQIKTLKNRLGVDEIYETWGMEDDAQGAAEDARYWMDGGDVLSPFEYWGDVLKGIKKPA